jgi:hypothetical protein
MKPNVTVEMKLTSPVYSAKGSQSISNTLPISVNNNNRLHFPLKWENADKVKETFPVIIEDGCFQLSGQMSLQGGSSPEGISFNIGFDEAILYAKLKDSKLSEIGLPVEEFPGAALQDRIRSIVALLDSYRKNFQDSPMAVFTVLLQNERVNNANFEYFLNPVKLDTTNPDIQSIVWERRSDPQLINGEIAYITVPDGYGVVPFLKVWKIIELIFEKFELQILENVFKTHHQLRLLCVPHNCIDVICSGKIDYSVLMPDETVLGFLNSLFAKFGAVFFINSSSNSVKIKLMDDILASNEYWDLTNKRTSKHIWTKIAQKQVRLKLNTGLKDAAPNQENFNEFLKSTNYIITEIDNGNDPLKPFSVAYERSTGRYYRKNRIENEIKTEYIGSDFFAWDAIENKNEIEEIAGSDESVPMIRSIRFGLLPYFSYSPRHVNTNLASQSIEEKETSNNCKLSFLFYYGGGFLNNNPGTAELYHFASPFNISGKNTVITINQIPCLIALTARSLFENFWRRWDAVLRHSNQQYELDINLSKSDILNLETHRKIIIDNQPFMIEELTFALGYQRPDSKLKIRSMLLKKPYDLDSEQKIPGFEEPLYHWAFTNLYDKALAELIERYAFENSNGDSVVFVHATAITYPTEETSQALLPPTEIDFQSNRIEIQLFKAVAYFKETSYELPVYDFSVDFQYQCVFFVRPNE